MVRKLSHKLGLGGNPSGAFGAGVLIGWKLRERIYRTDKPTLLNADCNCSIVKGRSNL